MRTVAQSRIQGEGGAVRQLPVNLWGNLMGCGCHRGVVGAKWGGAAASISPECNSESPLIPSPLALVCWFARRPPEWWWLAEAEVPSDKSTWWGGRRGRPGRAVVCSSLSHSGCGGGGWARGSAAKMCWCWGGGGSARQRRAKLRGGVGSRELQWDSGRKGRRRGSAEPPL
jgi:hypothetical protein